MGNQITSGEMKKIKEKEFIWAEKYRPQTIQDMILPESIKNQFQEYVDKGNIPNLLFISNEPGLGKCLDYSEELELYVSDEIYEILK